MLLNAFLTEKYIKNCDKYQTITFNNLYMHFINVVFVLKTGIIDTLIPVLNFCGEIELQDRTLHLYITGTSHGCSPHYSTLVRYTREIY